MESVRANCVFTCAACLLLQPSGLLCCVVAVDVAVNQLHHCPYVPSLQAVVPIMAAQGGGKIINIGSLTGFTPVPLRWVCGCVLDIKHVCVSSALFLPVSIILFIVM